MVWPEGQHTVVCAPKFTRRPHAPNAQSAPVEQGGAAAPEVVEDVGAAAAAGEAVGDAAAAVGDIMGGVATTTTGVWTATGEAVGGTTAVVGGGKEPVAGGCADTPAGTTGDAVLVVVTATGLKLDPPGAADARPVPRSRLSHFPETQTETRTAPTVTKASSKHQYFVLLIVATNVPLPLPPTPLPVMSSSVLVTANAWAMGTSFILPSLGGASSVLPLFHTRPPRRQNGRLPRMDGSRRALGWSPAEAGAAAESVFIPVLSPVGGLSIAPSPRA
jgi:hypothetical protein